MASLNLGDKFCTINEDSSSEALHCAILELCYRDKSNRDLGISRDKSKNIFCHSTEQRLNASVPAQQHVILSVLIFKRYRIHVMALKHFVCQLNGSVNIFQAAALPLRRTGEPP